MIEASFAALKRDHFVLLPIGNRGIWKLDTSGCCTIMTTPTDRHTFKKSTRPAGGLHVEFDRGALGDCHWS